jgi:hypothetical protein
MPAALYSKTAGNVCRLILEKQTRRVVSLSETAVCEKQRSWNLSNLKVSWNFTNLKDAQRNSEMYFLDNFS